MSKRERGSKSYIKHLDRDFRPVRSREAMQRITRGLERQRKKEFVAELHRL